MIKALDSGRNAIYQTRWMEEMIRDSDLHATRLYEICAANPEIPLSAALSSLETLSSQSSIVLVSAPVK